MAVPSSPDKNQGPTDHTRLLPLKWSGLCFQKWQFTTSFKTGLVAAVTWEGFRGPFLDTSRLLIPSPPLCQSFPLAFFLSAVSLVLSSFQACCRAAGKVAAVWGLRLSLLGLAVLLGSGSASAHSTAQPRYRGSFWQVLLLRSIHRSTDRDSHAFRGCKTSDLFLKINLSPYLQVLYTRVEFFACSSEYTGPETEFDLLPKYYLKGSFQFHLLWGACELPCSQALLASLRIKRCCLWRRKLHARLSTGWWNLELCASAR